jgi:DNA-binding CsgD family transcriptional regulator
MQRALARLDEAEPHVHDAGLEARADHLRGLVAMRIGPVMDGYPLAVRAAERIAATDPDRAVEMLAEGVRACFYAGDTPAMVAAATRASELAEPAGAERARFLAATALGMALVADGQGEAGVASVRRAISILEGVGDEPELLPWRVVAAMWLREADAGRGPIARAFDQARAQAAVGVLPSLLHLLARDQATTDRWSAAEASYDESIRLARETGQRVELGAALAGLAWLEARQGRAEACRTHAAQATELCDELGVYLYGAWAIQALGDLELGLGNVAVAVERYEALAAALHQRGIADVDLSPGPDLVEGYARLGRGDDAERAAADYAVRAEAKGQPWALARAARARGLLAEGDEFEAWFARALELHGRTPDAFETARTRLAFGARLRRARLRVRAREELGAALEVFEQLGAQSWADQADAELAAAGETARRRVASTLDDLTPQELQIARLLAEGRTTREAAAAIFVSPKTVEYHLRHVYDKLGIRSRQELAAALEAR